MCLNYYYYIYCIDEAISECVLQELARIKFLLIENRWIISVSAYNATNVDTKTEIPSV